MLIADDCGLDLVLRSDDTRQKVLTQTMLNQDKVFRNQVLELHRLYRTQKMLMKDLDLNLNICSSGYHHIAPRDSAQTKYDFIYDDKVPPMKELSHSRGADGDTWQKAIGQMDKIISHETTSLEGSTSHEGVEQNMSARRKLFTSYELDLNRALPDESNPSSGVCEYDWIKPKNNCSAVRLDQENVTNSTLTNSASKYTGEHLHVCSLDHGSVCGPPSDNKPPFSCCKNFVPNKRGKNCQKISMPEENAKKAKEDSQELVEGTDSNRSPISCRSDWITDDVSSSTKKGQSGNYMSNSKIAKKQELAEADVTIRKGAVSLLLFSSECFARNQENVSESKKRKECCSIDKEVPQISSESYESIVLKQQECSVDGYCVSSTQCEVSSLDMKDYGVKLKRGRRMKDFQKEILPGLALLSRQEICEDVKIMELAIRSREYKKYRSKMGGTTECFSTVRSRWSRHSYVGRRYYS